jgi:ATP-dependent DNA helicase RecQ
MKDSIAYIDIEVVVNSGKIDRLGLLLGDIQKSTTSINDIKIILEQNILDFVCGHNFIDHDKKFLSKTTLNPILSKIPIIDTLLLSMLLFVNKKTHKLDKPYKTEINIENKPLGDAQETKSLFMLLDKKFDTLDNELQKIFISLLFDDKYFNGYFKYKNIVPTDIDIYEKIKDKIYCTKEKFEIIQKDYTTELAFVISYLHLDSQAAISSVVLIRYPKVVKVLKELTFNKDSIDLELFALKEFNIASFREFEQEDNLLEKKESGLFSSLFSDKKIPKKSTKISQRDIIANSLDNKSILSILPTGGGKTFTFQMPALIKAKAYKGLTVVISPLQALMKNHVDSFKDKNQNFNVVAISGYLNPIERMNIITMVENGVVDILYIAPEALRSNSIFKALQKRIIERFVIDEAHCFSSWGHDFRHDYYFIANSIKELENSSKFQPKIPISCFTATAKPEVLKDIKKYFFDKLGIKLKEFIASSQRYNLEYKAIEVDSKKDKYEQLVKELIRIGKKPTIIYIPQNARECKELSETLNNDERLYEQNLIIEPFYSKIDDEIENGKREGRDKSAILNDFIDNKIDIVIATTAFGMGIDKPDIQTVIHYEQSDSLESYLQESGRGARDENLKAECIVLYSRDDFNRTFAQLNHSKLEYHEIERVVRELKKVKKSEIYLSPKQIAEKMGIDTEDSTIDYDTMIKTALLELEQAGVIIRGRNSYKIFATSINNEKRSMKHVHDVLDAKQQEYEKIYTYMIVVMQNIIQRSRLDAIEVDDLADIVGIKKNIIFDVLYALQKENLLEYNNDISIYVKKSVQKDFQKYFEMERLIFGSLKDLPEYETKLDLRQINSFIGNNSRNNTKIIKKIIQSWTHLSKLKSNIFNAYFYKDICNFELDKNDVNKLENLIKVRRQTCEFIIKNILKELNGEKEKEIEISTNKLKAEYDSIQKLSLNGFHHSLVYLHELIKDSFNLRRGRLIYYQAFKIDKTEGINKRLPYGKREHYNQSLKPYYERKIESIHIQIAFIERLIKDGWHKTVEFVQDYFSMEYNKFKKKYNFNDKEIQLPITQERFKEIIYDLNDEQKKIFEDKKSSAIMVLAGPGSGKTKTLVHKIASLVTIENNKAEYFLMLAHSRVAVAEFKNRLQKLIGNQVYGMKIYTFHAFAIELLGKKIDSDQSILHSVISQATEGIKKGEINLPYIQMLVLDEYQDVGKNTYHFIQAIYSKMSKDKKIIAVGDDNQCINNFGDDRSDIAYIKQFKNDFEIIDEETTDLLKIKKSNYSQYELSINYRSKKNIVEYSNRYTDILNNKLKSKKLLSYSNKNGKINFIKYKNSSYMYNLVNQVSNDTSETVAVLARNNDEVLTIYSLLIANDIKAKYITSKDGFNLGNLIELQDFLLFWKDSNLDKALSKLEQIYTKSKNYKLAISVINSFIKEYEINVKYNQKYFVNIFEEYLKEITFEEFELSKADVIVSTMHKAKGKEFDSVYLCIGEDIVIDEYDKRLIYVAITRAKNNLFIHTKNNVLDFLIDYCSDVVTYDKNDEEPDKLVFLMSLEDIALSNKYSADGISISKPIAGEDVYIKSEFNGFKIYKNNQQIVKLSAASEDKPNRLSSKIIQKQHEGYQLEDVAKVDHVVLWQDKNSSLFFKQVLCKVYMKKVFR